MSIFKKHKLKFIALILSTPLLIWWQQGFPGGYIPGKYNPGTNTYKVFWQKTGFACEGGYFRIKWYTPFKKHGLCDSTGRITIPFRYDNIDDIKAGNLIRVKRGNKFGVVNLKNQVIVPCKWPRVKIEDNYLRIYDSAKYTGDKRRIQALDLSGKPLFPETWMNWVIDYKIDEHNTNPFLTGASDSQSYFYFFEPKRLVSKPVRFKAYKRLWQEAKVAYVMIAERNADSSKSVYALMNKDGAFLLEYEYDHIDATVNDLFSVQQQNLRGLYDAKIAEWVLPIKYVPGGISVLLGGNLIGIKEKKNFRYMDRKGVVILSDEIYVANFNDEFINFYKKDKPFHLKYDTVKEKFYWYKGIKNLTQD